MKKLTILTCTMIALGFMATTVRAQSPHYIKGPTASLDANGDYCVSFKETGLGSTPITYTLTAGDGTIFTFQCFTKKGNTPQGAPNGISGSGDSTSSTITPHNGQISATICLTPEQDGAHCQGQGLVLRLIGVCYQNVTFTDTGTGQTFNLDPLSSGVGCP
jgi:hypothetical protein